MRQKLRPLILISFVLGLTFQGYSFRVNTAKTLVHVSAENTDFPRLVSSSESLQNELYSDTGNYMGNTPLNGTMYFQSTGPEVHQFLLFEENSYKTQGLPSVDNYNFSENASSVREKASTDQGVLFRQGMFYGFALMLFLLNLVSYFLFEEKLFMNYALALISLIAVFFYVDGLPTLIGIGTFENPQLIQSTLLLLAVASAATFASRYLSLAEFYPKLRFFTNPLMGIAALLVLMAWVVQAPLVANIANTIMYAVMACYFMAGVVLFSRKNYVKFYVIAYSIPLLFAIDFFVLRNLGIEFLFTEE